MTTTIKVIAHDDPCLVTSIDLNGGRKFRETVVEAADGEFTMHCSAGMEIRVRAVPQEFAGPPMPASDAAD